MLWHVVLLATHTGDVRERLYSYSNRGHAVSKYRGLTKRSWLAASEIQYGIRKG